LVLRWKHTKLLLLQRIVTAKESPCAIFGQQDVLKAILEQDGGDAQRK